MSQDLLSEFDSLYSAPVAAVAPVRSFTPTQAASTSYASNRRFTSVDPRDPLNLNLPPAPRPQLPLHNVPLVRTSHGHQQRASATNFDDLLGIVGSPQAPWPPRAPQVAKLGQIPRPVSFHGILPSSSKIDPFAALGNDFSGGDGRGGRFTPPPPRPVSRSDFDSVDGGRKSSAVNMGKTFNVRTFGGFSAPTPPPDLLGMGNDEEDEDDFGDFTSATPTPALASVPTNTRFGGLEFYSAPNITLPRTGVLGVQRGSNAQDNTPPPPSTPPKPKHRHQKSLIDDHGFGEFTASLTTSTLLQGTFSTPPPDMLNASPLATANTPPPSRNTPNTHTPNIFSTPQSPHQNTNRHSITLKTFSPPPKAKHDNILQPRMPSVSVLLTAFPPLFLLPQTHLLDKLTALPFPLRQRVLAHPKTKEFLESVCELGRVAGRIIAGRKRRNRPTLPSARNMNGSRGNGGGMKLGALVGANMNWEQQKEEREVKETCRLWGDGAGRLKAAMGKGVPDIIDEAIGGRGTVGRESINGAEGCRLCGLTKGEEVGKLKEKVEGGCWWEEGWGHRGCKAFWENHGKGLRG